MPFKPWVKDWKPNEEDLLEEAYWSLDKPDPEEGPPPWRGEVQPEDQPPPEEVGTK
jgi:hypothetical protein